MSVQGNGAKQLTPEEAKVREEQISYMGFACDCFIDVKGAKGRTLIGLGVFGLHVRSTNNDMVVAWNDKIAMQQEIEVDSDSYFSIKRDAIQSLVNEKRKVPANNKTEEPETIYYQLKIISSGAYQTVNFGNQKELESCRSLIWGWTCHHINFITPIMPGPTEPAPNPEAETNPE